MSYILKIFSLSYHFSGLFLGFFGILDSKVSVDVFENILID